jgi:hypothetical protein
MFKVTSQSNRREIKMTTETNTHNMQRRDFLKVMGAGLASVWMLSASSAPLTNWVLTPYLTPQTSFGNSLLRGTQSGEIFQSLDQGRTWQLLVFFGKQCAIDKLSTKNGQLYAQLSCSGYPFRLCSPDAKIWRTLN